MGGSKSAKGGPNPLSLSDDANKIKTLNIERA